MKKQLEWKELDLAARKWVRGWVAVMCVNLKQKIVHSSNFDDTMLFYFPLPQSLTREQFERTNPSTEIKVDWKNEIMHER
jgi:hypothetical protein